MTGDHRHQSKQHHFWCRALAETGGRRGIQTWLLTTTTLSNTKIHLKTRPWDQTYITVTIMLNLRKRRDRISLLLFNVGLKAQNNNCLLFSAVSALKKPWVSFYRNNVQTDTNCNKLGQRARTGGGKSFLWFITSMNSFDFIGSTNRDNNSDSRICSCIK